MTTGIKRRFLPFRHPARPLRDSTGGPRTHAMLRPVVGFCSAVDTKQHFQDQAGLDRGITEAWLATSPAGRWWPPSHLGFEPNRQRSAPLQRCVARRPVGGLVPCRGPTAHASQLSCWIHAVNPTSRFMQQSRFGANLRFLLLSEIHWVLASCEIRRCNYLFFTFLGLSRFLVASPLIAFGHHFSFRDQMFSVFFERLFRSAGNLDSLPMKFAPMNLALYFSGHCIGPTSRAGSAGRLGHLQGFITTAGQSLRQR